MVVAGGRMFYIFDEGPTASIMLPSNWMLTARDAFNGTVLWKQPIAKWHPHLYPFKSGPNYLARRLVAVGDRVYATLGLEEPLVALDAATGKTLRTYESTKAAEEVLLSDGVLFVVANSDPFDWRKFKPKSNILGPEKTRVETEFPWEAKPRRGDGVTTRQRRSALAAGEPRGADHACGRRPRGVLLRWRADRVPRSPRRQATVALGADFADE